MTHAEIQMLLAHGVPQKALVDAIIWGKMQRIMGSAYEAVHAAETDYLPPPNFADNISSLMSGSQYAEPVSVKVKYKTA